MFTQLNVHQRKGLSTQSLMIKALARSKLFDLFDMHTDSVTYTMSPCSGTVTLAGRCASNFTIEPVMDGEPIQIHSMIENDDIPTCRNEIPTPDVARAHPI